jgi:hypothetical protein
MTTASEDLQQAEAILNQNEDILDKLYCAEEKLNAILSRVIRMETRLVRLLEVLGFDVHGNKCERNEITGNQK